MATPVNPGGAGSYYRSDFRQIGRKLSTSERMAQRDINRAMVKKARNRRANQSQARSNRASLRIMGAKTGGSLERRLALRDYNREMVRKANPNKTKNLSRIRSRNAKNQARDSRGRFK